MKFLDQRKKAYHNEFLLAKKKYSESIDDEEDENKLIETMKNTLYNKFSGHLTKDKK